MKIILFDGDCNLCSWSVQFIIKRDPSSKFKFAALQSDNAKGILPADYKERKELTSIVLISGKKIYTRSTAALRIARDLRRLWPLLYFFILIPPFIRNPVYNWIAANRYRWFGKKDVCLLSLPGDEHRFLV